VIFVLAGAKPVSMRYDRALMSIGCPSMRWFLGLFLCRLVPVRRWLQTFILWLSGLLSVGLRQWNHLLNWYRFFGNLMCQLLLRSISFTDSWGGSLWLRRRIGCCQPCVVGTTSWFPEETNPLQTKFCVICRRSFSEFAVTRTFTDLSSVGSVEIHQIFFRGESLVLQSWRRVTVEVHQTFSEVGLFTERSRCWRLFSFRTCLWYRRWLNRSITSGFCPHCLYEAKGSDSLQIAGSSPDFLLGGHRLQRYAH